MLVSFVLEDLEAWKQTNKLNVYFYYFLFFLKIKKTKVMNLAGFPSVLPANFF